MTRAVDEDSADVLRPNLRIEREVTDHGDAHTLAENVAKLSIGKPVLVYVYRRIATYDAEIKVNMRKDGE